jgi:hypothetical protein
MFDHKSLNESNFWFLKKEDDHDFLLKEKIETSLSQNVYIYTHIHIILIKLVFNQLVCSTIRNNRNQT